jgi:DNA polymerase-3 subunit epsilon
MQRSFDDLGTPLSQVTFCAVDLETTGGAPGTDQITEVGAVKVRGGEWLGSFQTLVNPGCAIPPAITLLTGISEAMVAPAPRIEAVLPSFVEFAGGCVLVAHNAKFDVAFLNGALQRAGWARLSHPVVDTCALARRLVREEVPNCRLGTLASRFRLDHRPTHRALDDAMAAVDLLHVLLERAAAFGVLGLDDLLALPRLEGHPHAAKLRLTDGLPRTPGVYLFEGHRGEVLYVGKATNLRQRVRSYFSGDDRRKVGGLLREVHAIRHVPCPSTLEAAVLEVRLIHAHRPRYNRQATTWPRYAYLKLTLEEAFPRLSVVHRAKVDGGLYLGPLSSTAHARRIADAIHTATPLRRCTERLGRPGGKLVRARAEPCAAGQLGTVLCPCSGAVSEAAYASVVSQIVHGLTVDPDVLLEPLAARMAALAAAERFEEAADVRDRASTLSAAVARQRRLDALRGAGEVRLRLPGGRHVALEGGVLCPVVMGPLALVDEVRPPPATAPLPAPLADEVSAIAAWLEAEASHVHLDHCEGGWAMPVSRPTSFAPRVGGDCR